MSFLNKSFKLSVIASACLLVACSDEPKQAVEVVETAKPEVVQKEQVLPTKLEYNIFNKEDTAGTMVVEKKCGLSEGAFEAWLEQPKDGC